MILMVFIRGRNMIELANGISFPEGAVVQSIVCHMDNAREYLAIVEHTIRQTLPVIEVYLSSGGVPYEVPENATGFCPPP